jgi:ketosteroid isomerase-like protein
VNEKVELLRLGFEAFNRRDLDGLLSVWHPDAELHELADVPDVRVYRGHDGIRQWVADLEETFSELRFEPREFLPRGEVVFVGALASGRGRGSGVPLEYEVFFVFGIRDGSAMRAEGYLNREQALEAAGMADAVP